MRISHRTVVRSMTAAGKAQALAHRFAQNGTTGIEYADDDGGVDIGGEALEQLRPIHHRNSSDRDIVLDREGLARERTFGRAMNLTSPVPGVERILFGRRTPSAVAWILDHWSGFFELVKPRVCQHRGFQQLAEAFQV